ncbi:MAG: protein translocase subunit SecF [Spirochaetales bacterium]|nr:protein translocase subunit SecF [Spirochaetales bacterium]
MKKVIHFTKARFIMITISIVIIATGIVGTVVQGGLNYGIDFQAGLSQRVQIAPVAMKVSYNGDDDVRFNILSGEVSVDLFTKDGITTSHSYNLSDYKTIGELCSAMSEIPSLVIEDIATDVSTDKIISLSYLMDLSEDAAVVNYTNEGSGTYISIDEIRDVISVAGDPQIQIVGSDDAQEYLIRLEDDGSEDFSDTASTKVSSLLEKEFGEGTVIVKQADYVGPRYSQSLGQSVVLLVGLALALILLYIWLRFELSFAVSAIIALAHDVSIMIGFIGITQMEVVTATVAAVLTIVGYSLNDTIVVFDRIRENRTLMRDSDLKTVIDTSITQSLSRTLITSITTLVAVLAIYIFASGQIKDFALAMIVGVVVGTYSSIFIASPILLGWINSRRKKKLAKDNKKYGNLAAVKTADVVTSEDSSETSSDSNASKIVEIPTIERKKKGKRKKK